MALTVEQEATPRHSKSFLEAQSLASRRLGFSVTKACPLQCSHCSVGAAPQFGETTFGTQFAERVADQLPSLKDAGIRFIDFTGGEPTLARGFLQRVSAAATAVGIECSVVSAAHWARTPGEARAFVQKFPHIQNWDISTDVYHIPFVPLSQAELAFNILTELGRNVLMRIAHHEPMSYEDAVVIDRVHAFAGRRMAFQPIGPVGRGNDLVQLKAVAEPDWDRSPCPSTGPLVRAGGVVAPCCAPVSNEDYDHPLRVGNAFVEPLEAILQRWRVNPLLQTIRVWGFEPVVQWLRRHGKAYGHLLRHPVCHQCVELIRDRRCLDVAAAEASALPHRIRLAAALRHYFDEPWLDLELQREARALLGPQSGYAS